MTKVNPAAALNVLLERYPKCFFPRERDRKPIKLGIYHELLAAGVLPKLELHAALGYYCRQAGYLRACKVGVPRIDLNGELAGEVSSENAANARHSLDGVLEREIARAKAKRDKAMAEREAARNARSVRLAQPPAVAPPVAPGRRPILTLRSMAKAPLNSVTLA